MEAVGIGNLLMQVMADGRIGSLTELREVARRSFRPRLFVPDDGREPYEIAYSRFRQLTGIRRFWSKAAPARGTGEVIAGTLPRR
ncbi:hypothetical protein ACFQX6_16755 [Streptosporangium lutulentum]